LIQVKEIKLNISFYQLMTKMATITYMPDYLMHIQFITRKIDETKLILNKVLEYNKESFLIFGHIFDIINKYIYSIVK
jgi:hypothetical protein